MRHLFFSQEKTYPVCLLVPSIQKDQIENAYMHLLDPKDVMVLDLHYEEGKKNTAMSVMREYVASEIVPVLENIQAEYVICTDAGYFKALTKQTKVEANLGYVVDSPYGSFKVIYAPSYRAIFYDPDKVKAKIDMALTALLEHKTGLYRAPGSNIFKNISYPTSIEAIKVALLTLLGQDKPLTCDIETFSLKHPTSGIGTITFCWSEGEGIAFPVDLSSDPETVRTFLREFFEAFNNKIIYHNITFDAYILVYQLFMKDILDTEGLLYGLEVMLKNVDCTKIITYLATNSCAGNELSLKKQAQEFAGNYAVEEIDDITKIPLGELLKYNVTDGLSTWYVYNKNWPIMVQDQQEDAYNTIFKPAIADIIQMQLTGLPVNMKRVKEVKAILQKDADDALRGIMGSAIMADFIKVLRQDIADKKNAKWKKKRITADEVDEEFNPNSGPQIQKLLYEFLKLPVIAYTDSKQPATGGDTLESLMNHTEDPEEKHLLQSFVDYKAVQKILDSFIPAFEAATEGPDGWHYLFGNFNLGGTLSGRLSSNSPNLQNLPATGSKYAKIIKSCFSAPPGWIFCGLDFDSLEDKISGLTTKDPEKLKVYTDGYDGHSLRAYAYYNEHMPDIDPNSVVSINSIQVKYKHYRQESKVPTFALTYQGTYITLMVKCGFSKEKAQKIEQRYLELYKVSVDWVNQKLEQASKDGYVTAAFGLRVRTPLLAQVVMGTRTTPYEATAEGRSAGNALGQSWCLLNTRAGIEFNGKVRSSVHRLDIRPCAQIHDAQYFLIRDNIKALVFANEHLPNAVRWQEHPDIAHDQVKLSGEMFICHPDWGTEINLPNYAKAEEIIDIIDKATK